MSRMLNTFPWQRLWRFASVGGLAAFTHFSVMIALVSGLHWPPLSANIIAFTIAFGVSYWGQSRWTFAERQHTTKQTLWRYALTAILGFLINETTLFLGIQVWHWWYVPSLVLAIVLAALSTYLISHYWVFKSA